MITMLPENSIDSVKPLIDRESIITNKNKTSTDRATGNTGTGPEGRKHEININTIISSIGIDKSRM